jgi:hypothetical protein
MSDRYHIEPRRPRGILRHSVAPQVNLEPVSRHERTLIFRGGWERKRHCMETADWNQMAIQGLLADADRVLALTDVQNVERDRTIAGHALANAQQNYIDLIRRGRRLMLEGADEASFQGAMDRIQARLRFFGESTWSLSAN